MSKYINYDAIDYRHYKLHDKSSEFLDGVIYMAERIENAPSIDIVRCGECKLGGTEDCPMDEIYSENFCSYGERKDESQIRCPKCGRTDYIKDLEKDFGVKDNTFKYKCINCNTYIKGEPQTDLLVKTPRKSRDSHEKEDEPQTERNIK